MKIEQIYKLFDDIGCLTFATVDEEGFPQTRIAHLFASDSEGLYLRTMRVKPFYEQLKTNGKLSICGMSVPPKVEHTPDGLPFFEPGYTMRATGLVKEVDLDVLKLKADNSKDFLLGYNDILRYPNMTTFVMHAFSYEKYDYDFPRINRKHKLDRTFGVYGGFKLQEHKMQISSNCINCGSCKRMCDSKNFSAVKKGAKQYEIDPKKCDMCGSCIAGCPVKAITSINK